MIIKNKERFKKIFLSLLTFYSLESKVGDDKKRELSNTIDIDEAFLKVKLSINQIERARKRNRFTWSAAACTAAAVVTTFLFLNRPVTNYNENMADSLSIINSTSVYMVLSEGTRIELPDDDTVIIKNQYFSGTSIDGVLYCSNLLTSEDLRYNINSIKTPVGKDFKIILGDGSEIWMSAASSLSFPTLFNKDEREVLLEGEAFFKVKNAGGYPFVVKTQNMDVRVLGTHFDIRAYKDEKSVSTTLVKGVVLVSSYANCKNFTELRPKEQYSLDLKSMKAEVKIVDTSVVTAWMNEMFVFKNKRLDDVMLELRKWYNFSYKFGDGLAAETQISGNIKRLNKPDEIFDMITELKKVDIIKKNGTYMIKTK